ncbi:MAG TPA: protein kinase [Candidatus Limnocylindrales bacterium]|jgi:serine/threonine protein kinase/tetratricopeptide (TPR) repeat protein|nr:protein kinase [Candidatus Limnocylindrales bacterium]
MEDTLPARVRFRGFEFDLRTGELFGGEQPVRLSEKPLRLLVILLERGGELVTREEIQRKLWPDDTIVDFEHGINTAIKTVRHALGDSAEGPKYIETIPRRGYRLLVPVERVEPHELSDPVIEQVSSRVVLPEAGDKAASLIGKKVWHYRVLQVIGGGGMGMVYKAEDLKLGRQVALKFLPEEMASDPAALKRFEREARTASSLDHPNICTIYDIEEYEDQPVLVMEFLDGQTLRDHLAVQKALAANELLDIAIQICDGLRAAHEKGIIHRDIKPANIFLTSAGQVKILDFGLAKQTTAAAGIATAEPREKGPHDNQAQGTPAPAIDASATRTGVAMGTAGYMSPEQVRSEKLDARSDLFSFGLVLYEMATGQRAFRGETAAVVEDAILHRAPTPLHQLNATLPAKLATIIDKALEKDREQRWQSAAEMRAELEQIRNAKQPRVRHPRKWLVTSTLLLVGVATSAWLFWRSRHAIQLTDKDTIVLADFDNKTGDAVFDDTLKQGLSVQLEQSPFLALLSDRKVNGTLKLMGRPTGDQLTPEVAHEVCLRTGSKAMLTGSIAELGSQYVIGLRAVNCNTGDVLAEAQEQAADKEAVLKALDAAAVSLRGKLGESVSSVQKYATPLEEATTPSLEALQAYSLGVKAANAKGNTAALPILKRAVDLDPNFAMPYVWMSEIYSNLNEVGRAAENASKAYELRGKVSERERFLIEGNYYLYTTGELEKAAQTFELWQQSYPRYELPYIELGLVFGYLGNWEKALEEYREALRLEPNNGINYLNLGITYTAFNRLDEAEVVYKQAKERKLENELLLQSRYWLALLKGDTAQMAQLVSAAMRKPGTEDLLLATQADTEGWYGKLKNARELTGRAMDSAQRNDAKESAASYQAAAALREVESGNREQARAEANAAVKLAPNRDVRAIAALALARAGDTTGAEKLAAELDKTLPLDTLVQNYWLPTIRATLALQRRDPNKAVAILEVTKPLELGEPTNVTVYMSPVYVRGQAYLALHDGKAAAAEFQKFIDHRGVALNFPWGALARLGLARAYALDAATDPAARDKARTAYQNFLTLWKDADPDIPILKQAKAEYPKLQ